MVWTDCVAGWTGGWCATLTLTCLLCPRRERERVGIGMVEVGLGYLSHFRKWEGSI